MPSRARHRGAGRGSPRHDGLGARTPTPPPVIPTIKDVDFWFRINGTDVANTNSTQSLTDTDEREVVSFSQVLELLAGDYFELMFAVNDINVLLNSFPLDAVGPLTPSVIINITKVK